MTDKPITVDDLPELERAAFQRASAANVENMTDDEIDEWLDSLPRNEAIAVIVACADMQAEEDNK